MTFDPLVTRPMSYDECYGDDPAGDNGSEPDDDGSGDTKRRAPSTATRLVELARKQYRLGVTTDEEPFAVALDGPNVARMMRGNRSLRSDLGRVWFAVTGHAATGSALTDALNVLEGMAVGAEREEVHLRVAAHDGGVVVDLGDEPGRAVVIAPGRWDVVERSPVLFRRTKAVAAMPRPIPAAEGDLDPLRRLLNVTDESWPLVVGWMVAALLPQMPHPVLLFTGEQGTAKSWAARLVCGCIDPSGAPLRRSPTDPRDWLAQAAASWVVAIDNVSTISHWLSDALCRAVTGDGSVDRTLYTNTDVTVTAFRRVLCLTAIDAGSMRGDLAERLLPVELERIPDEARREDATIAAQFRCAQPRTLSGLFTLTGDVLAVLPNVRPDRLPRMADFGRVLAALDEVTGWSSLPTYRDRVADTLRTVVDDDLVAQSVVSLMDGRGSWDGTATELLKALPVPEPRPKDWPKSAQAVGGLITRFAPALRVVGLNVDKGRDKRSRTITITRTTSP